MMKIVVFETLQKAEEALTFVNSIGAFLYVAGRKHKVMQDQLTLSSINNFSMVNDEFYYSGTAIINPVAYQINNTTNEPNYDAITERWASIKQSIDGRFYFRSPFNTYDAAGVKLPNGETVEEALLRKLSMPIDYPTEWNQEP